MNTELKAIIEQATTAHPHAGPEELAHHVANNLPADRLRDYCRDLLAPACRTVINQQRRGHTPPPAPKPQPRPGPPPSPKLEERRSWWRDMLAQPVQVGADGTSKPLGDFTIDDLELAAKERQAHIDRLEERITTFKRLVALMVQHGVHTVAELPEQEQWGTEA
jgi:hypothetical protein